MNPCSSKSLKQLKWRHKHIFKSLKYFHEYKKVWSQYELYQMENNTCGSVSVSEMKLNVCLLSLLGTQDDVRISDTSLAPVSLIV